MYCASIVVLAALACGAPAPELGRAKVKTEALKPPVETFTVRAEPAGEKAASLLFEWEKTRIRIPVEAGK